MAAMDWTTRVDGMSGGDRLLIVPPRPALCVLEKLVHVEDAGLLPDDTMLIRYHAPDDLHVQESRLAELPENWRDDQPPTRRLGSAWLDRAASCLLRVPSVMKFAYDPRLLNDAPGGSRD